MKASHKQYLRRTGAILALTTLLFSLSNAGSAPSWLIMAGFIMLCVTLYYLIYGVICASSLYGLTVKRKKTLTLYATISIGVIMALQSSGQLGLHDTVILLPLILVGYFYNSYAKTSRL